MMAQKNNCCVPVAWSRNRYAKRKDHSGSIFSAGCPNFDQLLVTNLGRDHISALDLKIKGQPLWNHYRPALATDRYEPKGLPLGFKSLLAGPGSFPDCN